jgi:hypothetical protein
MEGWMDTWRDGWIHGGMHGGMSSVSWFCSLCSSPHRSPPPSHCLPGFLPPDVIELGKSNVDVNPEYSDSLDSAAFTVHLMFDAVSEASRRRAREKGGEFQDAYQLRGHEAFEAGLDEVGT